MAQLIQDEPLQIRQDEIGSRLLETTQTRHLVVGNGAI
jgi:hypothetical protein